MNRTTSSRHFLAALLIGAFILVCAIFAPYVSVFILAIVFGVMFAPINRRLAAHLPKRLAAIITTILVVFLVLAPVVFIIAQIIGEAGSIIYFFQSGSHVLTSIDILQTKLNELLPTVSIDLVAVIKSALEWLISRLDTVFSSVLAVILNFFLSIIALVYWFEDSQALRKTVLKISPLSKGDTEVIFSALDDSIHGVIRGTLIVAVIQGVVAGVGFTIFGIPNAVLWGAVAALCALVPTVGTAIISVPMVGYLLLIGHIPQAVGMTVWAIFAIGLIDNLVGPYLMARGGRVHPFFVLIGVLGGIELLGPIGLFAGPLIISCFFALFDVYVAHKKASQ